MGLFDQQQMTKPDISIDSGYQPQVGQGLMGLGQPQRNRAQGTEVNGQFVPTFSNPDGSYMSEGMMVNPQQPQGNQPLMTFLPPQETSNPFATGGGLPMLQNPNYMGQPQGDPSQQPSYPQGYDFTQPPFRSDIDGGLMPQGRSTLQQPKIYRDSPLPQAKPMQSFFEGPTKGQIPNGFSMINGELVNIRGVPRSDLNTLASIAPNNTQSTTPALNPTPQPPQIFQPQPMQQPMQPSNPVNTQTVQPNFMGQTPFGQAQTGQFTSTNPFVQAAQANAQGNLGGALQATAANRINQQTPYGSLSYQQTGTDAQGNPIWSANQQLSPELQQFTQSSLAGLQASQANPMYGINPGDTYSNAIMQRLAPQQSQAREALDAQLANQGIMPGSEAYNRAKVLQGQTQNDALTSAIVGGMQTGLQAQGLQNTTAANIRNLATPGYVTPYNQAAVAGPDYLSAYTSQNATDIARANAEAAQRSSLLSTLGGLGSSAILGGTGANSALGGLLGLGNQGLTALGNSSLWSSLFGGGTGPAITGDTNYLNSIGLGGTTYGSGIGGMTTDPLAGLYTNGISPEQNLSDLFNSSFGFGY